MKILLLGATGKLGSDCSKLLGNEYEILAPSKEELDIISWDFVIDSLNKLSPDIVINCAAITDPHDCESEDFLVKKINVEGPRNLAQGSARFNCRLVHISNDYIFSGKKGIPQPYFEDDSTEPLSKYGLSKLESEVAVRENSPNYVILRTSWIYGIHGKDFIKQILKSALSSRSKKKAIKVADDQIGSPTWTYRIALQIRALLTSDAKGTFHATSEGYCSRYELAKFVFNKLDIPNPLEPCSMDDLEHTVKSPKNCILENRLLKSIGLNVMPDWKKDLDTYLDQCGEELIKVVKS